MGKPPSPMVKQAQMIAAYHQKMFLRRLNRVLSEIVSFPFRIILSPFTLPYEIAGAAERGFGIPEFISNLSFSAIFALSHLQWMASIALHNVQSGEKPTAASVAEAIADNKAELFHLHSAVDLPLPLPSKECPTCDGSGAMRCPECEHKPQLGISADDIMEPPWKAYNVLKKMDYPYENIIQSMRDPKIAAFWLLTMPQIVGGFNYDDDVKQKIWWTYNESMRYDQLRHLVAQQRPGWEHLQEALISIDPARAREDPVIVKNIPFYKAQKALEAEVMKLDVPQRPHDWGDLNLPLSASSWSKEELKDPKKLCEMTVLLNAQREMAEKILDAQWEKKWRQYKVNELLEEKVQPYIKSIDTGVLSEPIMINQVQKMLID
ncbi:hypothetical protein ACLOJK_007103 [Asimina triloba]